jgi:hypothetical protein
MSLVPYATSAFSKHSLISTVLVVQNVVNGKLTLDAVLHGIIGQTAEINAQM